MKTYYDVIDEANTRIIVGLERLSVVIKIFFENNSRRRSIATGVKLKSKSEWLDGVVVRRGDAILCNERIARKLKEVQRALLMIEMNGQAVTPESVDEFFGRGDSTDADRGSFLNYMERRIEERNICEMTKRHHRCTLEALRRFGKIKEYATVTAANIQRFDEWLRRENPKRQQPAIYNYHKRLKVYITECVRDKKIAQNPYDQFKAERGRCAERQPLDEEMILMIADAELPEKYIRARDIFIFQCYTGLSYADVQAFVWDRHIVERDGKYYVRGLREKTDVEYYTPLLPRALDVLEKYGRRIPPLSNQKYNDYLHVIEGRLNIPYPITSHVARHSFATLMLGYDVPLPVVSRMLGHTNIQTTQIYAKIMKRKVESSVDAIYDRVL